MGEWKSKKLSDFGEIVTGKTPSKDNPEDWGDAIPFVTPSDYGNYRKHAKTALRGLSDHGRTRLKKKVLPKQSILVTCIGSDMGKVVMNSAEVVSNQQINAIVPDKSAIDPDFLYYLLRDMYEILRLHGGDGTAVPILNKGDFGDLVADTPLLAEQKAIAAVLSSLDDKIDLLHRQNKTLEALAETLFRQWFLEEAQEEWAEVPISQLGFVVCGKTPSKTKAAYFDGNIPFIKIPDMHGKAFIFDTADTLTESGANSQSNKTLPPRSICVSCIATVGLISMNAFESQTNQQINAIIPIVDSYRYYLYLAMKSSYDLLHSMASGGTATMNLNTGDFSRIPLPDPGPAIVSHFSEIVSPFFEKVFANQCQIRTLEKLRDTLLPKLMSGEVSVEVEP